jgi:quinoprotein relay system zinc metallohydrolase 2
MSMTRWRVITLLWLLAACPAIGAASGPLPVTEIAPGVFVHAGAHEEASARNRGDIANIGFIVGERCVAVIDTGGSPAVGRALKQAVTATTPRPICFVINTHVHPDHLLGNSAFADTGAVFIGHEQLPAELAVRAPYYLETASRLLGRPLDRSAVVPPQRTVTDTLTLDLGGRELHLRALPSAHTDTDLVVFDQATATLWLSDLLFVERVPSLDGSLKGWLAVLDELEDRAAARAVPGHGPPSVPWPEAVAAQRRYLQTLLTETRAAIARGATIEQAAASVAGSERKRWRLFEHYNRRNVQNAYVELEWE